ncbi:DNA-binding transcriptional regulator Fis [Oceanimonas sp. CHS3-5]|uniref:DNA-binding transcriptional regulator Fis n=1 Tax=Oceanimonas sp. CHS3-5 TaxID=3068186 RepID=UPI00273D9394|nr:DNA-binding transcriptional regulator Fis [Oceanimonas sp. CHS3-5]MDP5292563.1 DNA-binding transcriptional regulator Fis [Oceanimonas sp. CHS3-5]
MFEQTTTSDALVTTTKSTTSEQPTQRPLRNSVEQALRNYLSQLNGQEVTELYELVLSEVEAPMLDVIMQYTRGNQTRAANMMGINRGTLRKKLKKYGMN